MYIRVPKVPRCQGAKGCARCQGVGKAILHYTKFFDRADPNAIPYAVVPLTSSQRSAPPTIGGHAADNLRFIRQAMERSATFTAVPGVGGMLMGAVGSRRRARRVAPNHRRSLAAHLAGGGGGGGRDRSRSR